MRKKYENLNKVPLFGKYTDPFSDRRGSGKTRPKKAVPCLIPSYKRIFEPDKLYYSWMGHSSVFLHMHGLNLLIDPIFSKFTSPVPFLGPKRFPGYMIKPEDLPQIDIVLITHSHYDHLDRKTIRDLDNQVESYVVPLDVGAYLRRFGVDESKIIELGWYEECHLKGIDIALVPSQHDSGRGPWDMDGSLWGGFVIKDENFTVYDTGDGGFGDHFAEIARRYPKIDLAIMECGQYNIKWHAIHMFPEESVETVKILNARLAVPVHWGAYVLSDHAWDDPARRFHRRAMELLVNHKIPRIHQWVVLDSVD